MEEDAYNNVHVPGIKSRQPLKEPERAEVKFVDELELLIREIANKEGFINYSVEKKCLSSDGGNYLSVLYIVVIEESNNDKKSNKLNLFIKVAIPPKNLTRIIDIAEVYFNEMFVYEELSKVYIQLQKDAQVPEEEMYDFVHCFGVLRNKSHDTIILENLMPKGYNVLNRMKSVTLEYAKIAVDRIALFHALSYALKKSRPDYYDQELKSKHNYFLREESSEKFNEMFEIMIQKTIAVLHSEEHKEKVRVFGKDLGERFRGLLRPNKHSVLCHGDYRGNNILMKMEGDKLMDLLPIDYQLIYHGPPLNDLFFFIFTSTDQELRKHLNNIIDHYYQSLTKFLKYFSIDIDEVYERKDFDADVIKHREYGLMLGVTMLPFVLIAEVEVPNAAEVNIEDMMEKISFDGNQILKERVTGVVEDLIRWGY